MANLSSPGVEIKEIDLTTGVYGTSPTIGAYAGRFNWGPIEKNILVSNENDLVSFFGAPKASFSATATEANSVATSFLTASSYLAYASGIRVARVANINDTVLTNNAINAVSTLTVGDVASPILIKNVDHYQAQADLGNLGTNFVIAKYAGAMGNSIGASAVFTSSQYRSNDILTSTTFTLDKTNRTLTIAAGDLTQFFLAGDIAIFTYNGIQYRNSVASVSATVLTFTSIGYSFPNFPSNGTSGLVTNLKKEWKYASLFNSAPSTGEFHLVITDVDGNISGEAGTVLESFGFLSNSIGATNDEGISTYYKTVLNDNSAWVWVGGVDLTTALASTSVVGYAEALAGGRNGSTPGVDDYVDAYNQFQDTEIEISNIIAPPLADNISSSVVPAHLIQNIAEVRKDVVVYLSPRYADVVNKPKQEVANIVAFRDTLPSSSYAFMDSGWKYTLDKYNNTFRWVPLCGDTAGTSARTDAEAEKWFSNAGYTRGNIKGVAKLAFNPSKVVDRDALYQKGVNPVVTFNGAGTVLFGDKTLLARPSAFDRINVRKLFIEIEKKIANAAKYSLFEFNDEITRNRFVAIVDSYLREVQGRRGVTDYKVVCDETNNTAQVISENRFVGDVYIKANRSTNFIELRFVNTPLGATFDEIVGNV